VGAAVGLGAGLLVSHSRPLSRPFFGLGVCLVCATAALGLFLLSGAIAVIVLGFMLRAASNPVWSLMSAAAAEVTPERYRGRVYGLCETAAGAGDVGAPLLAGQLYAVDPRLPLVVAFTTTAPLALGAFGMHRRRGALQTG
jgi:MFS family permease